MYENAAPSFKPVTSNLKVGEYVHFSNIKAIFKRRYTIQIPFTYYLEDLQGEPIKGIFY